MTASAFRSSAVFDCWAILFAAAPDWGLRIYLFMVSRIASVQSFSGLSRMTLPVKTAKRLVSSPIYSSSPLLGWCI